MFLTILLRRDARYLGTFVVGPVLLILGLAVTVFYVQADQLVPALHSFWLVIHVSVAFVAAALFTLGFSTTILQLVQEHREQARAAGHEPKAGRFMEALPTSAALEGSSYSLHMIAFPLWTFTLIAGAIWAESAWGRYWNWDPKGSGPSLSGSSTPLICMLVSPVAGMTAAPPTSPWPAMSASSSTSPW